MTAILVASAKITIELYGAADTKRLAVMHHCGPQGFLMDDEYYHCVGKNHHDNIMWRRSNEKTHPPLKHPSTVQT